MGCGHDPAVTPSATSGAAIGTFCARDCAIQPVYRPTDSLFGNGSRTNSGWRSPARAGCAAAAKHRSEPDLHAAVPNRQDRGARTVPCNLSELCHSSTCMMTFRSPGRRIDPDPCFQENCWRFQIGVAWTKSRTASAGAATTTWSTHLCVRQWAASTSRRRPAVWAEPAPLPNHQPKHAPFFFLLGNSTFSRSGGR